MGGSVLKKLASLPPFMKRVKSIPLRILQRMGFRGFVPIEQTHFFNFRMESLYASTT